MVAEPRVKSTARKMLSMWCHCHLARLQYTYNIHTVQPDKRGVKRGTVPLTSACSTCQREKV